MKHKRKILTAAIFLVIFSYLVITITGLAKDIIKKKRQAQEMDQLIQQQEGIYNKLIEEQKLLEDMDPAFMEELARKLGMLKEGEILFQERDD